MKTQGILDVRPIILLKRNWWIYIRDTNHHPSPVGLGNNVRNGHMKLQKMSPHNGLAQYYLYSLTSSFHLDKYKTFEATIYKYEKETQPEAMTLARGRISTYLEGKWNCIFLTLSHSVCVRERNLHTHTYMRILYTYIHTLGTS